MWPAGLIASFGSDVEESLINSVRPLGQQGKDREQGCTRYYMGIRLADDDAHSDVEGLQVWRGRFLITNSMEEPFGECPSPYRVGAVPISMCWPGRVRRFSIWIE